MAGKNDWHPMVVTASISSIRKIDCDAIWQITRGGPDISGTTRVLEFAPSPALFRRYQMDWKQRNPDEWWESYKEQFMAELDSQKVENIIRKLSHMVDAGQRVALVCFCKDSRYCHRSLVAAFLTEKGFSVEEYESRRVDSGPKQVTMFV